MKPLKVNEIFVSPQGEGSKMGTLMTFVRFSGCNLRCPFCDTKHETGQEVMPTDLALDIITNGKTEWVCFTGGEPTLQDNEAMMALCSALWSNGERIAVETNGTKIPQWFDNGVEWITISPKTEIQNEVYLVADEIKIVVTPDTKLKTIKQIADTLAVAREEQHSQSHEKQLWLQPVNNSPEMARRIIQWQKRESGLGLRLGIQQQKVFKIR